MADADLCHIADSADEDVALCGAPIADEPWCTGPCPHKACDVCEAVEFDQRADTAKASA